MTLIVVVSVKDIDTLATVALALALISFTAQLLVFVVQTRSANEQELRSQNLYAELLGLLAQIRERTEGTQTTITAMNSQLLEHVLGKARSETEAAGVQPDQPDYSRRVAENAVRLWPRVTTATNELELPFPPHTPQSDDLAVATELSTFPSDTDEVDSALKTLEQLSSTDLRSLARLAKDEVSSRRPGATYAPGLLTVYSKDLETRGLIKRSPYASADEVWILTPAGRQLARLLAAEGDPPHEFAGRISALRAKMSQNKAARKSEK
ncbi:MAG TPA: hypothetical protein VNA20_14795 [Frankiaceae bacterium]|nr:hypothetical protein [Frankiaceae bacterium]